MGSDIGKMQRSIDLLCKSEKQDIMQLHRGLEPSLAFRVKRIWCKVPLRAPHMRGNKNLVPAQVKTLGRVFISYGLTSPIRSQVSDS